MLTSCQAPWIKKVWIWVPHTCYYHLYDKQDLYTCAVKKDVDWIHAMGDSQEREFVSMLKMVNGSETTYTKYDSVRDAVIGYDSLCAARSHACKGDITP